MNKPSNKPDNFIEKRNTFLYFAIRILYTVKKNNKSIGFVTRTSLQQNLFNLLILWKEINILNSLSSFFQFKAFPKGVIESDIYSYIKSFEWFNFEQYLYQLTVNSSLATFGNALENLLKKLSLKIEKSNKEFIDRGVGLLYEYGYLEREEKRLIEITREYSSWKSSFFDSRNWECFNIISPKEIEKDYLRKYQEL